MTTDPTSRTVRTDDGRELEVVTVDPEPGSDDARVLLFHHGTPGAAVVPPAFAEAAAARGLRTVLYSRPGYGRSTPQPGRRVADAAADVERVLDALGVDAFVTAGWSGGGPHALACAALLPGRCRAAAVVAGVAPLTTSLAEWTTGMGDDNLAEFAAAAEGPGALTAYLSADADALRGTTRDELLAAMGTLISDVDATAFRGPAGEYVAAGMRHALLHGVEGWRDDDLAFVRPWGVDLGSVAVPVTLWQGTEDLMVPERHGALLADAVRGARLRHLPGQGHVSLMAEPTAILDDLAALA